MKKVLSILLVLGLLFAVATVNVSAEEGVIIQEFQGSAGATASLQKNEDGTVTITSDFGDRIWGYEVGGDAFAPYIGDLVKVAFYFSVDEVDDDLALMSINPAIKPQDPWVDYCYVDVYYEDLEDYEGKKVVVVGAFTVPEEGYNSIEARILFQPGFSGTLDKVVIASNAYNFANNPDYELVVEWVDESRDPDAADNLIESVKTPENTTQETETPAPTEPEATTAQPTATPSATTETTAPAVTTPASSDTKAPDGDNTVMIVVIVIVAVVLVGSILFFITKKRKN